MSVRIRVVSGWEEKGLEMSNIKESESVTIMMGWGFGQDCLETLGND